MKLDVYYAAYGQREYMGNINDSDGRIVFRYDEDFLHRRVPVYPNKWFGDELISDDVKLPPALFWDFLPTGYNAEMLYKISNSSVFQIPVLKKLAMCSKKTIGAIEFEPALPVRLEEKQVDLDLIEEDIVREQNLGKLYRLLASINGHTPKITVDVSENKKEIYETKNDASFEEWIIKLPSVREHPKDGLAEYAYSQMAKAANIKVPEFHLFESRKCAGYFGSKRFDRDGKNKIHTLSAGALMNKYYLNEPIYMVDYVRLIQEIAPEETESLFKVLVFNMKTGNDDLRGTNISLLLQNNEKWTLAPAYDLVPFSLENDYRPKMLKEGYDKNEEDGKIYDLCELAGLDFNKVGAIIEETEEALGQYDTFMKEKK